MNKTAIRRRITDERKRLSQQQVVRASQILAVRLQQSAVFCQSQHVAFYSPINNELDPQYAVAEALKHKKNCYLPCIQAGNKALLFQEFDAHTDMQANGYHILEPKISAEATAGKRLDLVLVPLVAADVLGNRIGMGKGYYDHTFAHSNRPYLMGLAYDFQIIPAWKPDPWDVPLDSLCIVPCT